ncbi:hypothetical protein EDB97_102292 [Agrobacterium tumefaciens]|nr:hypothetical protein EDB97_102292 [Agrobacterium tumefaciens]
MVMSPREAFMSSAFWLLGAGSLSKQDNVLESVGAAHFVEAGKNAFQQTHNCSSIRYALIPASGAIATNFKFRFLNLFIASNIAEPMLDTRFLCRTRSVNQKLVSFRLQAFEFEFQPAVKKFVCLLQARLLENALNAARYALHLLSCIRFFFVEALVDILDLCALHFSQRSQIICQLSVIWNQETFDNKSISPRLKLYQLKVPLFTFCISDLHLSDGEERGKAGQYTCHQSLVMVQEVSVGEVYGHPVGAGQPRDASNDNSNVDPPFPLSFHRNHPNYYLPATTSIRFPSGRDVACCPLDPCALIFLIVSIGVGGRILGRFSNGLHPQPQVMSTAAEISEAYDVEDI